MKGVASAGRRGMAFAQLVPSAMPAPGAVTQRISGTRVVMVCSTSAAAAYVSSPVWEAVMVTMPAPTRVRTSPFRVATAPAVAGVPSDSNSAVRVVGDRQTGTCRGRQGDDIARRGGFDQRKVDGLCRFVIAFVRAEVYRAVLDAGGRAGEVGGEVIGGVVGRAVVEVGVVACVHCRAAFRQAEVGGFFGRIGAGKDDHRFGRCHGVFLRQVGRNPV